MNTGMETNSNTDSDTDSNTDTKTEYIDTQEQNKALGIFISPTMKQTRTTTTTTINSDFNSHEQGMKQMLGHSGYWITLFHQPI